MDAIDPCSTKYKSVDNNIYWYKTIEFAQVILQYMSPAKQYKLSGKAELVSRKLL